MQNTLLYIYPSDLEQIVLLLTKTYNSCRISIVVLSVPLLERVCLF